MIVLAVRKPYQVREIVPRVSDAKNGQIDVIPTPIKAKAFTQSNDRRLQGRMNESRFKALSAISDYVDRHFSCHELRNFLVCPFSAFSSSNNWYVHGDELFHSKETDA